MPSQFIISFTNKQKLHNSIENASKDTQPLYTTKSLREAKKNIIASVDHILQHDLVQENPFAAEFVSTMEKEMQNIKEHFNTKMMLILGSKNGRGNKLYNKLENRNVSYVKVTIN
jgi:hypothetical protein